MINTLQLLLEGALDRLVQQITTYGPGVLAAATILLISYLMALLARWLLTRIFKGIALDRFLRESGLSQMLDHSGHLRATRLVAGAAYWGILLAGALTALNAFNTAVASQLIEAAVLLLPKLVTAALILLAGVWLARYLSRSALVWACNEDLPAPRRLAAAVRVLVLFVAAVVAADHLNFARTVFMAAFVLLLGTAALAAGLALGLGGRDALRRHLERRDEEASADNSKVRSLWNHL